MPSTSESNTPLGQKIHSIMNLRLTLLRPNRSLEEEQLVDTLLVLLESYISAGRSKEETVLLVTRDYEFHLKHNERVSSMMQQQQQPMMPMSPPMAPLPGPMLQGGNNQGMHTFNHSSFDGASGSFFPGMGGVQAPPPFLHGHNQMPQMQSFSHLGNPQGTPQFGSIQNHGRSNGGGMAASASNASLNEA